MHIYLVDGFSVVVVVVVVVDVVRGRLFLLPDLPRDFGFSDTTMLSVDLNNEIIIKYTFKYFFKLLI